mmetsp:Transcript_7021/g.17157  ORF Transcript_7021/g.17157 Transcript_7021/m.17157 type:complete len:214 (-) Transcript_7021:180-821(-)
MASASLSLFSVALSSCCVRAFSSEARSSSTTRRSFASLSSRSRRRSSRSCSAFLLDTDSLRPWISWVTATRSASLARSIAKYVDVSARSSAISASCWSLSAASSSFSRSSSFTVFSCPTESPAPCSTRRERLEISTLSCEMVSFARASFSCDASTIFHAFSISRLSDEMVFWSSCESLSAVCTFAAFATISELSSRHFLISRFSDSCDLRSAR